MSALVNPRPSSIYSVAPIESAQQGDRNSRIVFSPLKAHAFSQKRPLTWSPINQWKFPSIMSLPSR